MNYNKTFTIIKFIEFKNSESAKAECSDERLDRFMEALDGISHWENGEYDLPDLEKAWNDTTSENPCDDHGV